jgi:multiple sugar transport system substrate-binding protein
MGGVTMKKGILVVLTMMVTLAIFITGCSNDSEPVSSSETDNGKEEVVLTMWGPEDYLKGEESPGQQMIKEFNEKYKGEIRVEAKYMPWPEFNTSIQAAVSSDDLPDIFRTPQDIDLRTIVSNGWIRPLDDIVSADFKDRFYPGSFMEGVNVLDDKMYTWPAFGPQLTYILYYNKDVLEQAGLDPNKPPTTWDELRDMSKTVTEKGKGDIFGLVYGGQDKGATSRVVQGFAGGIAPDENTFDYKKGEYTFDSKAIIDSADFLISLKEDGSILPASYTMKATEAGVLFGENKAAFMIEARWKMWHIKRDTPDANFGLSFVPTPTGEKPTYFYNMAQPGGYIVAENTEHPEEVGKFIDEAFANEWFYEKFMKSGVAVSPIEKLNEDESLYPYPEYKDFYQLHNDLMFESPNYAARNPETAEVITEMGSFGQPKVKPMFDEIMQALMTGVTPIEELDSILEDYNKQMNQGLQDAIDKVKSEGIEVSRDDFVFPNWNITKDYTKEDYAELE